MSGNDRYRVSVSNGYNFLGGYNVVDGNREVMGVAGSRESKDFEI